jgi:alkylhydroperoxidase/carboxymuconolactone decarboxylase family protein YurZ
MQQPATQPDEVAQEDQAPAEAEGSRTFGEQYPNLFDRLQGLRDALGDNGPLTERDIRLITLAFAIAKGLHNSITAETLKALKAGVAGEEIQQVALLAMTELGFSHTMNALGVINPRTGRGALR